MSVRRNAWVTPLFKPRYPRIDSLSYSRDNDITFSLGRVTDYDEVVNLLWKSGCVDPSTLSNSVRQLRITRNLDNGQVFITCAESGVADIWVDKLNDLELEGVTIQKCHSYTNKEIPVKLSYLHNSIDIGKDIVEGFLNRYGQVKEWFPLKDKRYGIPNGSYIFIMLEEELEKNPLPECFFVNHIQVWINYRTQVTRCHTCNEVGHYSRDCPKNTEEFPAMQAGQGGLPFMNGVLPSRTDTRSSKTDIPSGNVMKNPLLDGRVEVDSQKGSDVVHDPKDAGLKSNSIRSKVQFDNGKKAAQSSQMGDHQYALSPSNMKQNMFVDPSGVGLGVKRGRDAGFEDGQSEAKIQAIEESNSVDNNSVDQEEVNNSSMEEGDVDKSLGDKGNNEENTDWWVKEGGLLSDAFNVGAEEVLPFSGDIPID